MFCENCGAQLAPGAKFCENCGAKVTQVEQAPVIQSPVQQPQVEQKKSGSKLPIIIAIVVLLVALIVGGLVLFFNTGSRKADRYIATAEKYLDDNKYEKAIAEFEKAIDVDPKNVDAYLGAADAYIKWAKECLEDDDKEQAIECYNNAIELLEKGIDETGDKKLEKKLEKIKGLLDDAGGKSGEVDEPKAEAEAVDAEAYYKSFVGADDSVTADSVLVSTEFNDEADFLDVASKGQKLTFDELTDVMRRINDGNYNGNAGEDIVSSYSIITSKADGEKYLIIKYNNFDIYDVDADYALAVCYFDGSDIELIYVSVNWARSSEEIYTDGVISGYGSGGATDHFDWARMIAGGQVVNIYECETCDPYAASDLDPDGFEAYTNDGNDRYFWVEKYEVLGDKYYSWTEDEESGYTDADPLGGYSTGATKWTSHEEVVAIIDSIFESFNVAAGSNASRVGVTYLPVSIQ